MTHKHTLLAFVCWAHILYGVDLFLPFAGSAFFPIAGVSFYVTFFFCPLRGVFCVWGCHFFSCDSQSIFLKSVSPHFLRSPPPLSFVCGSIWVVCARVFVSVFFFLGGARCDVLWQSKAGVYVSKDVLCYVSV